MNSPAVFKGGRTLSRRAVRVVVVVVVVAPLHKQNAQESLGSRSGKPKRPAGRRNYRLHPPVVEKQFRAENQAKREPRPGSCGRAGQEEMTSKQRKAQRGKRMGRKTAEAVLIGAARRRDGRVACLVRREGNQKCPRIITDLHSPPPLFSEPPPPLRATVGVGVGIASTVTKTKIIFRIAFLTFSSIFQNLQNTNTKYLATILFLLHQTCPRRPGNKSSRILDWQTQNLILTVRSWQGDINDGKFPSLSSRCNRQTRTNKRRQVVVLPTNHGLRRAREEYYFHPRAMRRPTCVYRDPSIPASSIPASSIRFPPAPILPRSHASPSLLPPRCRSLLFPPSIATGPANLPGPARRWYRTHAITKANMRSNDARHEEHSINITLNNQHQPIHAPRLIGSTPGKLRWIPLINSNLLLAHPTHQPPPYQIQAKTSSPLAWPPPHTECSAGSRNGLPMFL